MKNIFFELKYMVTILLFILNTHLIAQVDLNKGLVLYLPLDQSTEDMSEKNHKVINKGAVLSTDRYGNPHSSYYFNGSDTCMLVVENSEDFNFYDSLTFSLWFKYDLNNKHTRSTLFHKGDDLKNNYWGLRRNDFGKFLFYTFPYSGWDQSFGQTWHNLEDGNWHWVAIKFHTKGQQVFVDGVLTGGSNSTYDNFLNDNVYDLIIGNVLGGNYRGWAGEIDEIRFYNRYLSNTEIYRLYDNPSSINEFDEIPNGMILSQNYPNPFNPTTTIEYSVPTVSRNNDVYVKLVVYDILGREIEVLVSEQKEPGTYKSFFSAEDLPSGIYLYQFRIGSKVESKKMMLVK